MKLDSGTYELLYHQYSPRLIAYASKILGDAVMAKDVVQDTFIRLWDKYEGKYSDSWVPVLFTITRNSCINNLKSQAKDLSAFSPLNMGVNEEILFLEDLASVDSQMADTQLLEKELQGRIETVASSLSAKCREVFVLSRVEGLNNEEIAKRTGVSVKAVEKQITKALKIFKKKI